MKLFLLILFFLVIVTLVVHAQTFSEWFHQKKTQINYLKKQIAALEVFKDLVEKGYRVSEDGAKWIADIKDADLNMHIDRFNSLGYVNPEIFDSCEVRNGVMYCALIRETASEIRTITSEQKTVYDWSAFGAALADRIVSAADERQQLLIDLTTDGKLKMSDGQRRLCLNRVAEGIVQVFRMVARQRAIIEALLKPMGS